MKNLKVTLAAMMIALFTVVGANKAQAQTTDPDVNAVLAGLIGVNISDIEVDIQTGDITLVNVKNVLNSADIDILNNFLNGFTITIDDTLNNLLRDADILSNNQIVVGILSSGEIVFQNLNQKPKKK